MIKSKILFCLLFIFLQLGKARSQSYFPVPPPPDAQQLGANIATTMSQLAHPQQGYAEQVRILVYGQSISEQDWWKEVKHFLQIQYRQANIHMINLAVGGFSTDRLKLIVENDVRSFYPDLILLHDYGNDQDYEQIIQIIRKHTTAEIALQTDHLAIGQNEQWHEKHNNVTLPQLAHKYGLALIDVRRVWKQYLEKNQLPASALLKDQVHLNDHGNYLMAEIIKNYFKKVPVSAKKPSARKLILQAGKDFTLKNNLLSLPVKGNRVDLVWNASLKSKAPVTVLLDNRKPSAYTESYYYTRPILAASKTYLGKMGKLLALKLGKAAGEEDWKLKITAVDTLKMQVEFNLQGSITGEDGRGNSEDTFISRSGKIIIEPEYWFRRKSPGDFKQYGWLEVGDSIEWQVELMGYDSVVAQPSTVVTVIQGVANTDHVLTLTGEGLINLKQIHIYQPPLKVQ